MSAQILSLVHDAQATKPDFMDVVACLRNAADAIERGDHGECIRAVLVLRCADRAPIVFGQGKMDSVAQAYMDLHAGAAELMSMRNPGRS